MLCRDDQRRRADRHLVLVGERDLALGVVLEEIDRLGVAVERELVEYAVRIIERGRHQVRRPVGRVAETDTLIAGALGLVAAPAAALTDIARMATAVTDNTATWPVETVFLVHRPPHRPPHCHQPPADGGRV